MKSRKLNERLDEIQDAVAALTLKVDRVANFTARVDERVETLEERMRHIAPHDGSAAALDRSLEAFRRQTAEIRRENRSRIAGRR
jgi:hypothetical protein